jgi:hypothetical protein
MDIIKKLILGKMDVSELKIKRKKKKEPSLLNEVLDKPENFKLEAFIENEEIIVKIKRRES